jgi:hypothetical protein
MKNERRWARRCSVSIPLHLKVGIEYVPARVLSLSEGGMTDFNADQPSPGRRWLRTPLFVGRVCRAVFKVGVSRPV